MKFWRKRTKPKTNTADSGRKKLLIWIFWGTVLYLVFLIATIPATWLSWGLTRLSHGLVTLTQAKDSLWNGSGNLIIAYPRSTPQNLGRTQWRINALWLIMGRIHVDLQTLGSEIQGKSKLTLTLNSISLDETKLSVPASVISRLYSPASLFSPKGEFYVQSKNVVFTKDGLHGNVNIHWRNAGSSLSAVQPLGDYQLLINGKGENADIKLVTEKGNLNLAGQGSWNVTGNGQIRFNGTAKPQQQGEELEPLLKLLGKDLGGGRRLLKFNGRLPLLRS